MLYNSKDYKKLVIISWRNYVHSLGKPYFVAGLDPLISVPGIDMTFHICSRPNYVIRPDDYSLGASAPCHTGSSAHYQEEAERL